MKNQNMNKNYTTTLVLFFITYVFLIFVNAVFPTQSDDIGRKIEGIGRAIESYKSWNGRFGELLLVTFGSYLSTTIFYGPINGLIGSCVIMLAFVNIRGRLPEKSVKDISFFGAFLVILLLDTTSSFGSIFYWAAGSFNYLWAWLFILLLITPVVSFWRGEVFSEKTQKIITASNLPLGIIAGWSSEFAIVIIVLWITTIIYAKIRKIKLPLWYYTGLASLCLGWIILYISPALKIRGANEKKYISLTDLFKSGPEGIFKRLIKTYDMFRKIFYYQTAFILSLFLLETSLLKKTGLKKILAIFLCIILLALSLFINKLIFMLLAISIFLIISIKTKKQDTYLANLYLCMAGLLIVEFLYIGATIQIYVPRRARIQFTFIFSAMFFILMEYFFRMTEKKQGLQKAFLILSCFISASTMIFVASECFNMHLKWKKMEKSIFDQKAAGLEDIIVEESTFDSIYWSYGDWSNPHEFPFEWPNTSYAQYYGVKTFTAQ